MPTISKIFVVIDPTNDKQVALERAVRIAERNPAQSLHLYAAVFSTANTAELEALKRAEIARHRAWIETMVAPVRERGIAVEIEVEWKLQWRDALAPAAKRCGADLIVKAPGSHVSAGRWLLKTSDWTLIRQSPCPVYLTKGKAIDKGAKFLVALDLKKEDDLYNTLNTRVIEFGQALAKNVPDSVLHAVNAYSSSQRYVYPSDLAKKVGIASNQAHTIEGPPAKVITEVANEVQADVIIIGTASRDGARAAMIGNTAEKILDTINANILVVTAR